METRIINLLYGFREITGWTVNVSDSEKDEIYLINSDIESLRRIRQLIYKLTIYVTGEIKGERATGRGSCIILHGITDEDIRRKIEETVFAASLALNPYYSLPESIEQPISIISCDKSISENRSDALEMLKGILAETAANEKDIKLASAETFLTLSNRRLITSKGVDYSREVSSILFDMVLLAGAAGSEVETQITREERFLEVLDIRGLVARYSDYTRNSIAADLPRSGKYNVIFTEESLDSFFDYFQTRLSGEAVYNRISNLKPGDEIIRDAAGDKLTLAYDPGLKTGFGSSAYDSFGTVLKRHTFVKNGICTAIQADKQYSDYLGIPATGSASNLVVDGGAKTFNELLTGGDLIVYRFSDFRPNPVTGGFSGEIRSAAVYDGRKMVPVKGGSVTGMMSQAMKKCFLSKEITQRNNYRGPLYIKVQDLDVEGR